MINLRVAAAATVTLTALLLIWIKLAEKGYETSASMLEKQNRNAAEQQDKFRHLARKDMGELGAQAVEQAEDMVPDELADPGMRARQLRPLGTWAGFREDDDRKPAFMKFDKENYWIIINDPAGGDTREKGDYEYLFDSINFKPEGLPEYRLSYFMVSRDGIRLAGYDFYYNLERDENIKLDF
jgi:hypothetical protein